MDLNELIFLERRRQEISQQELARQLDIHPSTLGKFERGKSTLTSKRLQMAFRILGIKVSGRVGEL